MNNAVIGDFGQKIAGAKKDRAAPRVNKPEGDAAKPKKPRGDAKPAVFAAYRHRAASLWWIEKKGDRGHRRLKEFASREALAEFWRLPDSREILLALWNDVREREKVNDLKLRGERNMPRVGPDYRGGADVAPERFMEVFKPYGVQFGNWQKDRDLCLNQAHDAFLDLANFLRLAPEAIAFGGRLGLAFGARGHGKAAAHYELAHKVINLTKPHGAGCLAHEWFHAYDHNACVSAGLPGLSASAGLREVLRAIPYGLRKRSAEADRSRSGAKYYSKPEEMLARAFEAWVRANVNNDYLANILKLNQFGCGEARYPYPLESEMPAIDAAFRKLFALD
jgi:hypothetical protein